MSAVTVAEGDNERGLLFGDVARACAQKAFDPIASVCKETRLYIFISIDFFSLIELGGGGGTQDGCRVFVTLWSLTGAVCDR